MDQTIELKSTDRKRAIARLSEFVAASVDAAPAFEAPFFHFILDKVFPEDVYAAMLALYAGIVATTARCTAAAKATISKTARTRG